MEIPLVFEPARTHEVFDDDDDNIDNFGLSFSAGADRFRQFRFEIQKRLMMRTGTNDVKLLLELKHLDGQVLGQSHGYDIELLKVKRKEEEQSLEKEIYNLSVYPKYAGGRPLFKLLRDKFGDKFEVKAKYRFVDFSTETPTLVSYCTGESGVVLEKDGEFDAKLTFEESTPCPELKSEFGFQRTLILILCFRVAASKRKLTDQCAVVNKKMLKMELATDAVIVSGEGKEFKCHKSFLFAHSPVLQAMLLSGMEETRTSRIVVPDLSEEVVEVFLQYIYTKDISGIAGDNELCFGVLCAAHKYEVKCLERHIIQFFQDLENEDFGVDLALKLFMLLGSVPDSEKLRKKTAVVMMGKLDALSALPEYDDLFEKNPKAAKELNKYFAIAKE